MEYQQKGIMKEVVVGYMKVLPKNSLG